MKNRKNSKKLESIFREIDGVIFSNKEMDQNLEQIGVDPSTLVSKAMSLVQEYSNIQSSEKTFQYMPMAAGKSISVSDESLNKALKNKRKKRGKGKSQA
jgi:BRCA2 repeat